jgi:hypothetical protein
MANDLQHMLSKSIHLKLGSMDKPVACTVRNVESGGLWISGSPILEAVVHAGAARGDPMKDPVIFVPFRNVDWFVMAGE